jgi:hypothetical protein
VIVVLVGCGAAVALHLRQANKPLIPAAIQQQLPFSPLILAKGGDYDAANYKYDSDSQTLSYKAAKPGSTDVVITEQTLPPQFTEVQGYQDQFLSTVVKQTSTVNTSNGVIYLGHASKDSSQQIGVLIGQGLLVFMSPQGSNLTARQWRQLGEQLQIEKGF